MTNSDSRSDSNWPRTMRATCGQPSRPMTAITDSRLGPTTDTKMITSSSVGMLRTVSVARISTWSTPPPKKPADQPDQRPDRDVDGHGTEADDQRRARTEHDAREDVAPGRVGAQQVQRARRRGRRGREDVGEVRVRQEERPDDRDHGDDRRRSPCRRSARRWRRNRRSARASSDSCGAIAIWIVRPRSGCARGHPARRQRPARRTRGST